MEYYPEHHFKLPTSQDLAVRQPRVNTDLNRFHEFVCAMPGFRKNYFRYDVSDFDRCRDELTSYNGHERWALLAEMDGDIVATGSIDRQPFAWSHHVAELRCTVAPPFTHLGIGRILLHQLVELATNQGIERLFVEVLREHRGAQTKLAGEGFSQEAVRPKYVRDVYGNLHDVVVMSIHLQDVWGRFEEMLYEMDCRFSAGL